MKHIPTIVSSLFLMWLFASWVDIVSHNLSTCIYASWNFFALFF